MVNNKCPLCNSQSYFYLEKYIKGINIRKDQAIVECQSCGHIFSLIKSELDVPLLYKKDAYKLTDIRGSIYERIAVFEYTKILTKINHYFPQKDFLLDFGCGKGKFLQMAENSGWHVKGIETSVPRANYGRSVYQLNISTKNYSRGKLAGGPFGVISFFHVLEHLYDPKQLLFELIEKNLKRGGLLLIEVPNINSLQSKISGGWWMHLDIPRHISHFCKEKLDELLLSLKLRPIRWEYFSLHLGVLGMIQSLMQWFGYRKNIIYELKFNRRFFLLLSIFFLFPWAFILEWIASAFKRGGIIRIYAVKD